MTEYITHIVTQGLRFRVAITPVSKAGASPIVATSWAEQDGRIFESDSHAAAEAFIGQMPDRFWRPSLMAATPIMAIGDFPVAELKPGQVVTIPERGPIRSNPAPQPPKKGKR